jgi:hypothetical protein
LPGLGVLANRFGRGEGIDHGRGQPAAFRRQEVGWRVEPEIAFDDNAFAIGCGQDKVVALLPVRRIAGELPAGQYSRRVGCDRNSAYIVDLATRCRRFMRHSISGWRRNHHTNLS